MPVNYEVPVNDCQMAGGLLAQLLQVPQAQLILLQIHSKGKCRSTEALIIPSIQYSEHYS
jgi:hypothetical protein